MYKVRLRQWIHESLHLLYQMRKNILPIHRKNRNIFRLLGGGVPSPFIFREGNEPSPGEENENEELQPEVSGDDVSGKAVPDPGSENLEEESDDEVVQQPIPFQMGVTPVAEEGEVMDELQTWYEGAEELEPQARGSAHPVPKKSSEPRPKPSIRERSPRSLRNR